MPSQPPSRFEDDARILTTRMLAAKYNQTEAVVRRWRSELKIAAVRPTVRSFYSPMRVMEKDAGVILTSDWHVPYQSDYWMDKLDTTIRTTGIKDIVAVGDLIDLPTISRFDARDVDSYVGMELSALGDVLHHLDQLGTKVTWMRGNHELRFFRALKHQVGIADLMRLVDAPESVAGIDNETMMLIVGAKTWLLTHPQNYNKTPLTTARTLAAKYNMNIATAHNHLFAMGYANDGETLLLETGGLFDPRKMAYLNVGGLTSSYPKQQNGFWILHSDGRVEPVHA